MTDKQSIANKIKALLSKTVENGCTEFEAMAAMSLARHLMDKHNISRSEVDIKAEGFKRHQYEPDRRTNFIFRWLWHPIERLTFTNFYSDHNGYRKPKKPTFFGVVSDVDFAVWLSDTLIALINRDTDAYIKSLPKGERSHRRRLSFTYGMAKRIGERIIKECDERDAGLRHLQGTGLVVVNRKQISLIELERQVGKLVNSGSSSIRIDGAAMNNGRAAGDRATWDKPVNGGGKILAIG